MSGAPEGAYSRRGFLSEAMKFVAREAGNLLAERVAPRRHFRPPGALPEPAFLAACTRCGYCQDACPVDAIVTAPASAGLAAGTPVIQPMTEPCIACDGLFCAAVCPTGALVPPLDGWRGERLGVVTLDSERCIAYQGVQCGVCARVCPIGDAAIFLDDLGRPVLTEACVGCGVCSRACVTSPTSLALAIS